MTAFWLIMFGLCIVAFAGASLVQYHIWMTYRERLAILDAVKQAGERQMQFRSLMSYYDRFSAVRYEQHLWYRLTLRDPFMLYQPWYDALLYDGAMF